MSRFTEHMTVDVPVRVAYDRWTRFEDFPSFMDGVERVKQLDDKTLEWTATVAGVKKTWTAEIVDQTPDKRIAWKSVDGADNAGAVLFEPVGPASTNLTLMIDAEPEGPLEAAGDALGFLERRVKGDLQRFKDLVERTGAGVDGWRGDIKGDEVRPDPSDLPTATSGSRR